jgi:hypothetical protein
MTTNRMLLLAVLAISLVGNVWLCTERLSMKKDLAFAHVAVFQAGETAKARADYTQEIRTLLAKYCSAPQCKDLIESMGRMQAVDEQNATSFRGMLPNR